MSALLLPETLPLGQHLSAPALGAAGPFALQAGTGSSSIRTSPTKQQPSPPAAPAASTAADLRNQPPLPNGRQVGAAIEVAAGLGHLLLTDAPHWQEQQPHPPQRLSPPSPPQQAPVPIPDSGACCTSGRGGGGGQRQPPLGTWAHRQYMLPLPGRTSAGNQPPQRSAFAADAAALEDEQRGAEACSLPPPQQQQQQAAFAGFPPLASSLAQPIPGTCQEGPTPRAAGTAAAAATAGGDAAALATAAAGASTAPQPIAAAADDDDEALARAAWRWRFAKRWQAEQARQIDAAASGGDSEGGMEEVLAYLAACGQPWDMSRTMSADGLGGSGGSATRMMGTIGSMGLLGQEQLLVGDYSRNASLNGRGGLTGSGRGVGGLAAAAGAGGRGGGRHGVVTRELSAVTRRATQLLQTQTDLESAAEER